MARTRYHYTSNYADTGQPATGWSDKKKHIEALAAMVSSSNFGVGRRVCVYRYPKGDPRNKQLVSCWVKGARDKVRSKG